MNAKLSGLFSGFPTHHFTDDIALVLKENLPRGSLVFISGIGGGGVEGASAAVGPSWGRWALLPNGLA